MTNYVLGQSFHFEFNGFVFQDVLGRQDLSIAPGNPSFCARLSEEQLGLLTSKGVTIRTLDNDTRFIKIHIPKNYCGSTGLLSPQLAAYDFFLEPWPWRHDSMSGFTCYLAHHYIRDEI